MKLIKLNAIDSTNEFIKKNKLLFSENLFCVYTFNQTLGKGQRGNIWNSQPFKNLCISFYFKPNDNNVKKLFFKLNMLVSIKILHFLKSYKIDDLKIKWPNDILSADKKIAGILIETSSQRSQIIDYIIGIGLNVNQLDFNELSNASSIKKIMKKDYDLNLFSKNFIEIFSNLESELQSATVDDIKAEYLKNLYGTDSILKYNYKGSDLKGKITDIDSSISVKMIVNGKINIYKAEDLKLIY